MTDEASTWRATWRATSLSVPPNTPVGCYVGDAQLVMLSHKGSENVCITVSRPDTLAEAEPAPKPAELPVDRCIRLMGELEEVWEEVPHAPGSTIELFSLGGRLKNERKWLEEIVAAVRGPQATSDQEEADQEEWVECEWTQFVQHEDDSFVHYIVAWTLGAHHLRRQVKQLHLGVTPAAIERWRRHRPSALPRWVYDQLKPVADS